MKDDIFLNKVNLVGTLHGCVLTEAQNDYQVGVFYLKIYNQIFELYVDQEKVNILSEIPVNSNISVTGYLYLKESKNGYKQLKIVVETVDLIKRVIKKENKYEYSKKK